MKKPRAAMRRNGTVRCAMYTRKSSEEGLEQEFNSLQAQREACEAFIDSQRHEGWVCLRAAYDDGGFLRRDDGSARSATTARRRHGGAGGEHGAVRKMSGWPPPSPLFSINFVVATHWGGAFFLST